jgi:hypothetical protein
MNTGFVMILEIFKDSFKYSSKNKEIFLKIGVLSLLSPLIIPFFILEGFLYRIICIGLKGVINGEDPLPRFKNLKKMFIEGIKLFLVQLIYGLPGTISLIAIIYYSNPINIVFTTDPYLIGLGLGLVAIVAALWLIFYLFAIVAITHMIENNGSLKSAFKFKEIIAIIKSIGFKKYLEFYLGYLVIGIGILTTAFLLILIFTSIICIIDMSFSNSYNWVMFFYLTGAIFEVLAIFFIIPFFKIFESRAIALIYNMRELI